MNDILYNKKLSCDVSRNDSFVVDNKDSDKENDKSFNQGSVLTGNCNTENFFYDCGNEPSICNRRNRSQNRSSRNFITENIQCVKSKSKGKISRNEFNHNLNGFEKSRSNKKNKSFIQSRRASNEN